MSVNLVCSACLKEACAQGVLMCDGARAANFILIHARHEEKCPLCHTNSQIIRSILEAVCRRDGVTLDSGIEPGQPARNFELADRLGIGGAFNETP